jgi:excinuclease ABC subunit A
VVKTADWVIDLGPEGGHRGGEVVAQGPPERVARTKGSYTGQFLAEALGVEPPKPSKPAKPRRSRAAVRA